jgi:cellulose synthase (UDP-forming)
MLSALAPDFALLGFFVLSWPWLEPEDGRARAFVCWLVLILMARYFAWRIVTLLGSPELSGLHGAWLIGCFVGETLLLADSMIFFLLLSRWHDRSAEADAGERALRERRPLPAVDVFIPTYNEGLDVLERTIVGALALDYPNFTVWVLDDGRRDWLRDFCRAKGARYLRREHNTHAKAGNINHALAASSGEFIGVFDADFVPYRNFLWRTLGFFADPQVGCVQTPQHFFNKDPVQLNLQLDRVWPDEQRFFFHTIMPSRDAWGAAFCCGSCMILRRAAMQEIGGVPIGSITEDMLQTLVMLRHGYRTIYLDEPLSAGLAPESLEAFIVQRKRWCRGNIQLLSLRDGPLGPGLSLLQRLFFFPGYWLLLPLQVFFLLVPVLYFWLGLSPLPRLPAEIAFYQSPALLACFLGLIWCSRGRWLPLLSQASNLYTALRLTPTVLHACFRPFGTGFAVTPKGRQGRRLIFDGAIAVFTVLLLALTLGGIGINLDLDWRRVPDDGFFRMAGFWGLWNALVLFLVLLLSIERPRRRAEERFLLGEKAICTVADLDIPCRVEDLSSSGAKLAAIDGHQFVQGAAVSLQLPEVGPLPGRVLWTASGNAGLRFTPLAAPLRAKLEAVIDRLARERPERRGRAERIELGLATTCRIDSSLTECAIENASLTGALLSFAAPAPPIGSAVTLDLPGVGQLQGRLVRQVGERQAGLQFDESSAATRDRLIRRLYTEPTRRIEEARVDAAAVLRAVARRAFGG